MAKIDQFWAILARLSALMADIAPKMAQNGPFLVGRKSIFGFHPGILAGIGLFSAKMVILAILGSKRPGFIRGFSGFRVREEHFCFLFQDSFSLGKMSPGWDPANSFGICDGKVILVPSGPDHS